MKRGVSRGSMNGAAALPPSPLTAVTRYGPARRSRVGLLGRILFWLLVTLLVAAGGLAGGVWLYFEHSIHETRAHSAEAKEAQAILDVVPPPDRAAVAMVLGYDSRLGADKGNPPRSDTVLLVRADPQTKAISLLSFPRDLVVEIPACRSFPTRVTRINEAYTECGTKGALQTIRNLTGIPINYFITVNFRGFTDIVNELGGVYIDVDRRYFNDVTGPGGYAKIDLHPGYQRLKGGPALDYVRYRHTDSDLYRNARQQEFLKAVKQQVSGLSAAWKLHGIVNAITSNVEVGVGGGGTLEPETVLSYAKLAYELPSGNFHQVRIDGLAETNLGGASVLTASESQVDEAVEAFMNPDPQAAEKAAAVATGGKPKATGRSGPPAASVTVEVLNGNGVTGAADDGAFLLARRGYQAVNGGDADRSNYFRTQIFYDPANADGSAAAADVAKLFGDADVAEAPAAQTLETTLRVIVGQTFKGRLAPGPKDETPEHEPAAVERDSGEAAQRVKRAQRRVGFPLLVPTLREKASDLSTLEPIRTYKLAGHDAVRLVYNGPFGTDYWGVQQTNWTDAPPLNGPSLIRRSGGREYKLFFNGSHLHVVAFEENGGAYWVVNTLLDKLSNETMLAIARGLKPIKR
ncbi:MAG: LCP family protein [Actinomycetota bacterium]|nr:LCP family protein [Actinomycetota bacterium]